MNPLPSKTGIAGNWNHDGNRNYLVKAITGLRDIKPAKRLDPI